MSKQDKKARAAARRETWTGWVSRGGEHRGAGRTEPELALSTMYALALEGWAIAGRPLPEYERATMPGKIVRRGS